MPTNGWGNIYCNSFSGDTALASGGGGGFDADYQAVLDYATTQGYTLPSSGQQTLQNTLVTDLKTAGVWNKLDAFSVFATDGDADFALIDWVRLTTQTAVSSPTFTANQGYLTDGVSSYIDTLYNPTTDGVNYTLNSASFAYYVNSPISNSTSTIVAGARNGTVNRIYELTGTRMFINSTVPDDTFPLNLDAGFRHLNRSASPDRTRFVNGVGVTNNNPSTQMPNAKIYLGCISIDNTPSAFESNEFALQFSGGDLSAEAADFNTAIQTYITSI